ncbi:LytR/AlgR family response regulator transcription factor [[Clostridium] dakarense]|uniref:LytR/AlgR family response regulator transcription factor n=1 Tax=Faecalimicrobium dakarense TaxID=1301100 RepID=UPI0004B2E20B|nr:LytTR family DNA-binding domain-containing protein [[Clostridium] dakarense]
MYNIAICEDEIIQANQLERLFRKYEKNENVVFNIDKFSSGELLIDNGYDKYDIIVLDIKMEKINGIEVAKIIRKTNENIKLMFVTAMEKYWPEGYNVNAFRYIVKPIDENKFYEEINNIINAVNKTKAFITINNDGNLKTISINNIKYLEILHRKVHINTISGVYTSNQTLRYWNKKLYSYGFANPHSSYLVNMKYVTGISKEKVTLLDGETIYVSQRKYKDFKNRFIKYIGQI